MSIYKIDPTEVKFNIGEKKTFESPKVSVDDWFGVEVYKSVELFGVTFWMFLDPVDFNDGLITYQLDFTYSPGHAVLRRQRMIENYKKLFEEISI